MENKKLLIIAGIVIVILVGVNLKLLLQPNSSPLQTTSRAPVASSTEAAATSTPPTSTTTNSPAAPTTQTTAPAPVPTKTTTPTPVTHTTTPTPAPTPTYQAGYHATIYYDGHRFLPSKVTIISGGTVTWVNQNTDAKMWIASDPFPNDDGYPVPSDGGCGTSAFNQCASVGHNGTWSFTFTKLGGWNFHNDLDARDGGIVNVVTKQDYQTGNYNH